MEEMLKKLRGQPHKKGSCFVFLNITTTDIMDKYQISTHFYAFNLHPISPSMEKKKKREKEKLYFLTHTKKTVTVVTNKKCCIRENLLLAEAL